MPINISEKRANRSIVMSYLKSVRKEVLQHMIQRQEVENIEKGYQDRSNYYELNMQNASKDKLIAYYMLIKSRRCVTDKERHRCE